MNWRALAPLLVVTTLATTALVSRHAGSALTTLPTLTPQGGLSFEVLDADTNEPIPCKLTLVGQSGTPTPQFTKNDIGRQEGNAVVAYNRVMSLAGIGVVPVPFGTYDIYISRGPEWDLYIAQKVHITAKGAQVRAKLHHVVDTRGWISGDFHVHAAHSSDSHVPMQDRIYEFASDGVEVIVSTDHNVVSNYAPIIAELAAGPYITSLTGDELTTGSWGHFGAFPLPQILERTGQGAVLVHGRTAADYFADVRRDAPDAIIDVHHPRIDSEIGYFNMAHFDARADRSDRPGFSLDFDALEVLNGYQDPERRSVDRMIDDWFALLNHGHLVTATGNSDTHHLDHNIGGYPRNYVEVQDDRPAVLRPEWLTRGIKGHRSFFTTAPFVKLHVNGGSIGNVVRALPGGKAHVEIEVQAAPWVSVSTVTLYIGGNERQKWTVPKSEEVKRFTVAQDFTLAKDDWVVVRVDGDKPLAPVVGDLTRFDVRPFALTNPVFVDLNANGKYDAGLPHGTHTDGATYKPSAPAVKAGATKADPFGEPHP